MFGLHNMYIPALPYKSANQLKITQKYAYKDELRIMYWSGITSKAVKN